MNKFLSLIIYIALTSFIIIKISFQYLSDHIGELNLGFIGEGEEAYNNCDLIAFLIQLSSSMLIAFFILKALNKLVLKLSTKL